MIHIQLQRYDPHVAIEVSRGNARAEPIEPFGKDGLTFADVLDMINPLHHIPLIGSIYRKLTGDTIDPAIRIAGGALFGGPIGAAVSLATLALGEMAKGLMVAANGSRVDAAVKTLAKVDDLPGVDAPTVATVNGHRFSAGTEPIESRQPRNIETNVGREIRRGGWMVIQAYGALEPVVAKDRPDNRLSPIRLSV